MNEYTALHIAIVSQIMFCVLSILVKNKVSQSVRMLMRFSGEALDKEQ